MADKENTSQENGTGIALLYTSEWADSPNKFISDSKPLVAATRNIFRNRQPFDEYDPNSQDSGYSNSSNSNFSDDFSKSPPTNFRFRQPGGMPPRRNNTSEFSSKVMDALPCSPSVRSRKVFHTFSTSSSELSDDGFIDQLPEASCIENVVNEDENAHLPPGFNSLLSGTIFGLNKIVESPVSSLFPQADTPTNFKKYFTEPCIQRTQIKSISLKSSVKTNFEDCILLDKEGYTNGCTNSNKRSACNKEDDSTPFLKRRRSNKLFINETTIKSSITQHPATAPALSPFTHATLFDYGFKKIQRSLSETEATIKQAVQKASSDPNLIGDFSRPFALPLKKMGRHSDLKNISCNTLAKLINGVFDNSIHSYAIIDCRYPYEYKGGHIKGAVNIYTREELLQTFTENQSLCLPKSDATVTSLSPISKECNKKKRNILIFHCEFSSERGPALSRYLRNADRDKNSLHYPQLYYPEMYLLDGGYSKFFQKHKDLCEPRSYRPMLDPNHAAEYKVFRARSKSWAATTDSRSSKLALRTNLKRLGL